MTSIPIKRKLETTAEAFPLHTVSLNYGKLSKKVPFASFPSQENQLRELCEVCLYSLLNFIVLKVAYVLTKQ